VLLVFQQRLDIINKPLRRNASGISRKSRHKFLEVLQDRPQEINFYVVISLGFMWSIIRNENERMV
jgi:hypothetical protein